MNPSTFQPFNLSTLSAAGQKGAICVGWATSMEKIRPRDGALPKGATNLFVRLARGEKESVQLFVVAKSGDLRNVKVAVNGDLVQVASGQSPVASEVISPDEGTGNEESATTVNPSTRQTVKRRENACVFA
ncbi:MAG: hypothetical protein IJK04_14040, partial [Kiritimatiellae bacterium]|nr:hypothetical protein [Kiritimatiellia bacterium]